MKSGKQLLATKITGHCRDETGCRTLREYLAEVARTAMKGEDVSIKRLMGDSDWQTVLGEALVRAGVLPGEILTPDEDDPAYIECEFNWNAFEALIDRACRALARER